MKKVFGILFALCAVVFLFIGLKHRVTLATPQTKGDSFVIQEKLRRFHPTQEDKQFVFVVVAENAEKSCERQLQSIFSQTYSEYRILYFDNASQDKTAEKVKTFCESNQNKDKLILTQLEKSTPPLQVIYEAIHRLEPTDIVVCLDAHDWLSHENVLDHLNCAYANPEVWLTSSRVIYHPDYEKIEGKAYGDNFLMQKKCRALGELPASSLISFHTAFFNEIRLEDFLFNGSFVSTQTKEAFLYPLIEMGSEHVLFLDEVMLVKNDAIPKEEHKTQLYEEMTVQSYLRSLQPYPTLSSLQLHTPSHREKKGDVIIFSENGPLHLYASLESIYTKLRNINSIYVIYEAEDHELGRAYLNLKNDFPNVEFLEVCDYPGKDFESLLFKAISNKRHGADYALLLSDGYIFDQKLFLHEPIDALEKVHADHFFLSLEEEKGPLPQIIPISAGIYAWQMGDEQEKQPFHLSLCRKALLEKGLNQAALTSLAHFKQFWKNQLHTHTVALFYEEKKGVPLKLNGEIPLAQKKQWGQKFNEGYKIDLPSLLCEIDEIKESDYPLIKREKWKKGLR